MNHMHQYTNEQELQQWIETHEMTILYFSSSTCGACSIIRKRIGELIEHYPNIEICDIGEEQDKHLAASWQVFSYPLMILFVDGKETIRIGKNIDFLEFEQMIARYYHMLYD